MMENFKLSIIAALDEQRGIGYKSRLPWKIKKDLDYFKKITLGYPIIMGRKTFESIGKPLPKRINIIVTRNKKYKVKDCFVFDNLKKAIKFAKRKYKKEVFIIGGGEIYKQAIGVVDKLYLTLIKGRFKTDTFFPDYSTFTEVVSDSGWLKENKYFFKFLELEKK